MGGAHIYPLQPFLDALLPEFFLFVQVAKKGVAFLDSCADKGSSVVQPTREK